MEASRELVEPSPRPGVAGGDPVPIAIADGTAQKTDPAETPRQRRSRIVAELKWPFLVYLASRVLLAVVAFIAVLIGRVVIGHASYSHAMANWDGKWYLLAVRHGYPAYPSHAQTTLGFLPLYPMVMWALAHVLFVPYVVAGVLVSLVGGFVAVVLTQRLATRWWDAATGRRAVLFFCAFPGSVVFSMMYSEGLLIPLAMGCLLALGRRRWLLAGVLSAFATAAGPDALVLVPVCAVAAALEIHRRGWRDRSARRSLIAPVLAPMGLAGFGIFLWAWTGTPLASYEAQRYGWGEKSDPFAILNQTHILAMQFVNVFRKTSLPHQGIDLNLIAGEIGAAFLVYGLVVMWRYRSAIPIEAWVWTLGISMLVVTSEFVPPNARMLLTAFPLLYAVAHHFTGRRFTRLMTTAAILLVVMSDLTFVGFTLRP